MVRIESRYQLYPHVPLGLNTIGLLAYINAFKLEFGEIQCLESVTGIIEQLNGKILWSTDNCSEGLMVHEDRSFQITLTFAHQHESVASMFKLIELIGYFILHSKRGVWPMRVSQPNGQVKREAQLFATGVLYSRTDVVKLIAQGNIDISPSTLNVLNFARQLYGIDGG